MSLKRCLYSILYLLSVIFTLDDFNQVFLSDSLICDTNNVTKREVKCISYISDRCGVEIEVY